MKSVQDYGLAKKIFAGFSAAYVAVFVYMLIFRPLPKDQYEFFFNLYQAFPPFFAGIAGMFLGIRANNLPKNHRLGWFLVGLACFSFSVGQSTWFVLESLKGVEVPFPGPPDYGYLGMVPFMIVGVLLLVNSGHAANKARQFLDSAIVVSAFACPSWYFMIKNLWAKTDLSLVGRIVSVAYPLGDIAIMFVAMAAIMSSTTDRLKKKCIGLVATGILLVSFSDTAFTFLQMKEQYATGSPFDWGWSFGWLTIGWASLTMYWNRSRLGEENSVDSLTRGRATSTFKIYAPYLAVIATFAVMVISDVRTFGHINLAIHSEIFGLILLILARQVFVVLENVKLASKIQSMNDGLELVVKERTRQLESLQELSKAVNSTLELEDVLAAALTQSIAALGGEATAIWTQQQDALESSLVASQNLETHADLVQFMSTMEFEGGTAQAAFGPTETGETGNILLAKIIWQGEMKGKLAVVRWNRVFDKDDTSLIESIAIELGTAVQNAEQHAVAVEAADHDSVTGLLNHRAFQQRIERALRTTLETEQELCVMVTDLDNFKLFNDTYGHLVGDEVLRIVAKAISVNVPEDGIVARFGGDEFVVALPNTEIESAQFIAKKISEYLVENGYKQPHEERVIPIGISIGIASAPVDGKNRHELLMVADKNLYEAKVSGNGIKASSEEQRTNRSLKAQSSFETLDALVTAVDNKDRYTRKHSEEVTEYALWIAEEVGLSEETMRQLRVAGLLHDVGKIGVPDEILRKPGRLSPEEFEIMQRHPRLGELIVGAIPGMSEVVDGVRCHHERWDGQGYPDQLCGADIPLFGRLLAVADAFSAMTTDRPYRAGMDWKTAVQNIQSGSGTQFDPEMTAAFVKAVRKRAPEKLRETKAA